MKLQKVQLQILILIASEPILVKSDCSLPPANKVCEGNVLQVFVCSRGGPPWQGVCVAGGVHGRGHAWQGDVHSRWHAW